MKCLDGRGAIAASLRQATEARKRAESWRAYVAAADGSHSCSPPPTCTSTAAAVDDMALRRALQVEDHRGRI